ncbi:DUF5789 family protein [Halomicrobium salinisoli]|uniref:DUF5789 family protein n=1 Tax=Halomicrobium salinisoli TaxID=2878391 RepID=UPI001CF06188|nr:hypothetical protein [Halomicrobium salinisoli]
MADDSYDTDTESVQENANERRHERTETIEDMLGDAGMFDDMKYPVRGEELAVEYGDQSIDMPNETESLGSVFDRLVDEEFGSPQEVREAVYDAVTGEAAGPEEYNDERELSEIEDEGRQGDGPL